MNLASTPRQEHRLPEVRLSGFGGYCHAQQEFARPERHRDLQAILQQPGRRTLIARGAGQSYGDAALNGAGTVVSMQRLDRMLAFDPEAGVLRAEAGTLVLDVMRMAVPRGFTLPVAPGLSNITLGGCAAFDVHSKNHWRCGGFGDWVLEMRLLLATGEIVTCTRGDRSDLFYATLGGLGLTGIILDMAIQLERLPGAIVHGRSLSFQGLPDMFDRFDESLGGAHYAVAWIDLLNQRDPTGVVLVANLHGGPGSLGSENDWSKLKAPPLGLIAPFFNGASNRAFNYAFAARHRLRPESDSPLRPFLFPWDRMSNWNRLYGRAGFVEYQCCLPAGGARVGFAELIGKVLANRSDFPVFFAAAKRMRAGVGMLTFPIDGYSLLLDFPVRRGLWPFLDELDSCVSGHGGRVFLAKDGRLSAAAFARMYPGRERWLEIRAAVDPDRRLASDMGRRLDLVDC